MESDPIVALFATQGFQGDHSAAIPLFHRGATLHSLFWKCDPTIRTFYILTELKFNMVLLLTQVD